MIRPALIVEIEFTPGVWTAISADVRGVNTKRGKTRALDKATAGTMTVTLANSDRKYDPENTASYGSQLAPGKAIRVKGTYSAVTYPIFTGQIESITQQYHPPHLAFAILQCTDGLAKLANAGLGSPYEVFMSQRTPRTWLRLSEKAGPYAIDRSGNGHHGYYFGTPNYGAAGLLFLDDDTSVNFDTIGSGFVMLTDSLPTTTPATISFVLNTTTTGLTSAGYIMWDYRYPYGIIIYLDTLGRINIICTNSSTGTTWYSRTTAAFTAQFYVITIVLQAGQIARIYNKSTDATDVASAIGTCLIDPVPTNYYVGNFAPSGATWATPGYLNLDELAIYDTAFVTADMDAQYLAAIAWDSDTGNNRITRILDSVGWSATARSITTAFDDILAPTSLKEAALEHLQKLEATIEGRLDVKADGTLRLLGRNEHLQTPYSVSQGIFGDAIGELGYREIGDYVLDWLLLTNDVRRTNMGTISGNPPLPVETIVEFLDSASIATYGKRDKNHTISEVDSQYKTLAAEYDLAAFRAAHYSKPTPYISGLKLLPGGAPTTLWPQALGRELGDRITFKRRPQGIGAVIATDTIIEGIEHTITPDTWETSFRIDAIDALNFFVFDSTLWDSGDWRFTA